jgi:hypothetical protein
VVDSKTAEDKQTNKGGTPAKPKSSKSVAFASSTKEDELVADTNSDEGGITSSKPDRVEDRGEEEEPPVVEREELLNLLDTLQSRMAELERRATEAEAGLQISKSSKGSRRKRYSKESETDDDSDSSLEGISLRDTSAAADIITKLPFKWHADSNAFEILQCLTEVSKVVDNIPKRRRTKILLQLLATLIPDYDVWEKTVAGEVKTLSTQEIIESIKEQYCNRAKVTTLLQDTKQIQFQMNTSDTIRGYLNRTYRYLGYAIFLGNELSTRFQAGMVDIITPATSARIASLISGVKEKLNPITSTPTKDTMKADYLVINSTLSTLAEEARFNSNLQNPDTVIEGSSGKKLKDRNIMGIGAVGSNNSTDSSYKPQGNSHSSNQSRSSGQGNNIDKPPCPHCMAGGYVKSAQRHSLSKCIYYKRLLRSGKRGANADDTDTEDRSNTICSKCYENHPTSACMAHPNKLRLVERLKAQLQPKTPESLPHGVPPNVQYGFSSQPWNNNLPTYTPVMPVFPPSVHPYPSYGGSMVGPGGNFVNNSGYQAATGVGLINNGAFPLAANTNPPYHTSIAAVGFNSGSSYPIPFDAGTRLPTGGQTYTPSVVNQAVSAPNSQPSAVHPSLAISSSPKH